MALSPEDRDQIWEEETLREQARIAITRPHRVNRLAGLAALLNKPLTIWLLSSIVLALVAFGYSKLEHEYQARQERLRQIADLDIELTARIRNFNNILSKQESVGGILTDHGVSAYLLEGNNEYSIVAPYRELPLQSLVWKLEKLVPEDEKEEISSAASALEELYVRNYMATQYDIQELRVLVAPLQLGRWVGSPPD